MPTYNERVLDELHKIKSGVSSMCIDTGTGEICTSSIGTGSTVTIYADGEVQAGCRRFGSVQGMVDYVSNRPEEWEGETSEEGLEEWAVKATAFAHYAAGYLGLTLPKEKGSPLVNNDKYGPQTAEIKALFERAKALTVDEVSALHSAQGVASNAAWNAARNAARGTARCTAQDVAWNAAWGAAQGVAWGAAQGVAQGVAQGAAQGVAWNAAQGIAQGTAGNAAGNAARALVVRDLIGQHGFTQEHYNLLTHVWAAVIGPVHPDDAPIATHPTLTPEKGSPLVNNDKYGPQTAEVEALFERAKALTVDEVSALHSAQGVAWNAARGTAQNAARGTARGTAWSAAQGVAQGVAWDTAKNAAGNAAGALVVRDLIGQHGFTQEHYNLLTHVWAAVIGPVHPDDAPIATHPTLTPEATEAPATQTDNNTVFTITGPMSMTYENGVATIVGGSLSINPAI